jgi:hypothetical protein
VIVVQYIHRHLSLIFHHQLFTLSNVTLIHFENQVSLRFSSFSLLQRDT